MIQELVHVTTFGSVDQEHQGVTAATLAEQGLQTLAVVNRYLK